MLNEGDLNYNELHRLFEIVGGKLVRKCHVSPNARRGMEAGGFDETIGYYRLKIKGKSYLTHRVIFFMSNGHLPDLIDHIDGDTTNNQSDNLREATKENNRWNCSPNKSTQSGVKGVYYDRGRWKALVNFKGDRYYLGMYSSIEEAAEVVRVKYELLQGEYSKTLSQGVNNG